MHLTLALAFEFVTLSCHSMKNLLYATILCTSVFLAACEKDEAPLIEDPGLCWVLVNGDFVQIPLDAMPVYLDGGEDGFFMAILDTVRYPSYARENMIQGLCRVHYEISEAGEVENIVAVEDPGGGIGDATIAALTAATQGVAFSPGVLDQMAVRVRKELRVRFRLG